jgi:hypothetical protein
MNKPLLAAICLGATLGGSMLSMTAKAEIYKWKDANGVIRYSDIPPPANVQTESLKSGRAPAPAPVAKPAATKAKATGEGGDTAAVKPEDVTPEKVKEAEDILKKQNCQNAKTNLNVLNDGPVYRMNEKGEREDLDQAAIAKEKEKARQEVEKYCK